MNIFKTILIICSNNCLLNKRIPVARDVVDHRVRQADENDEKVTNGQVEYENVGNGAHVNILHHDENDKQVAHNADEEDDRGYECQCPFENAQLELVDAEDWLGAIASVVAAVVAIIAYICEVRKQLQ